MVYYSDTPLVDPDPGDGTLEGEYTSTSYTFTSIPEGAHIYYYFIAYDTQGNERMSKVLDFFATPNEPMYTTTTIISNNDDRPVLERNSKFQYAVAFNGTNYGICWIDDRYEDSDLFFAVYDTSGTIVGEEIRLRGWTDAEDMKIAASTTQWLITYNTNSYGWGSMVAHLLNADGTEVTDRIDLGGGRENGAPVWNGTEFGIFYIDRNPNDLLFNTIATDGTLGTEVTNATLGIDMDDGVEVDAIWDGTNYVVAGNDGGSFVFYKINASTYATITVFGMGGDPDYCSIATDGTDFYFAYQDGDEIGITKREGADFSNELASQTIAFGGGFEVYHPHLLINSAEVLCTYNVRITTADNEYFLAAGRFASTDLTLTYHQAFLSNNLGVNDHFEPYAFVNGSKYQFFGIAEAYTSSQEYNAEEVIFVTY